MLKHGLVQAGRCKLFVQYQGRGIRKTPLCTVGYSDKRRLILVAWMMWMAMIEVAPSLPLSTTPYGLCQPTQYA